tara:strand:+ start:253 stop:423 length:171 start_codon:yes stop_codon:yes gene_type:complete
MVRYDVFSPQTGTVGRHKSLEEAVESAKKMGNIPFAIFRYVKGSKYVRLIKWVKPK